MKSFYFSLSLFFYGATFFSEPLWNQEFYSVLADDFIASLKTSPVYHKNGEAEIFALKKFIGENPSIKEYDFYKWIQIKTETAEYEKVSACDLYQMWLNYVWALSYKHLVALKEEHEPECSKKEKRGKAFERAYALAEIQKACGVQAVCDLLSTYRKEEEEFFRSALLERLQSESESKEEALFLDVEIEENSSPYWVRKCCTIV